MKRLFLYALCSSGLWTLAACGPSEGEIRRAITEGLEAATQERVVDLGYKLGRWLTGTREVSATTRHFRAVEGQALAEQLGYDAQGDQTVQVVDSQSLLKRIERIIGKELVKEQPSTDLDIRYHFYTYYAEATETSLWTTTVTTTKVGVNTDVDRQVVYRTDRRGIMSYWLGLDNDLRSIWTRGVAGMFDPGLQNIYGFLAGSPYFLGKKDPQLNEMFVVPNTPLGSVFFRVTGTEKFTLTLNGTSQDVLATRIEVKAFVPQGDDPQKAYIANCLPWTHIEFESTGATNTTINGFDCPAQILNGTVLWYENHPVKFEGTIVSVAVDSLNNVRTASQAGVGDFRRANDPGFGYELFTLCDPDTGDATTTQVTCRFFSTVDDGIVDICDTGGTCAPPATRARIDFRQRRGELKRYVHFQLTTSTVRWQVTEIKDEPLQ